MESALERLSTRGFIGNLDFIRGTMKDADFAYEILKLEALDAPITLAQLKEKGWLLGAPQKYAYVKEVMANDLRDMKTTSITAHSLPIWPGDNLRRKQEESEPRTEGMLVHLPEVCT